MKKFLSLAALLALAFTFSSCDKEDDYPEVKSGFRIDGKLLALENVYYDSEDLEDGKFYIYGTFEDGSSFTASASAEAYNGKKIDLTKPDPKYGTKMKNGTDEHWGYYISFYDSDGNSCYVWGGDDPQLGCPGSYLKFTAGKKADAPMSVEFRMMHMNLTSETHPMHLSTITFKGKVKSDNEVSL